jgi:hypothetical protein
VVGNVVIAHEQFQVINMVSSLQLSLYIPEVFAGKNDGIAVTFFTTTVPDSWRVAGTRCDRD